MYVGAESNDHPPLNGFLGFTVRIATGFCAVIYNHTYVVSCVASFSAGCYILSESAAQVVKIIVMEMFVWSEVPTSGKVEWRSTCLENGVPSLTLTGLMMML